MGRISLGLIAMLTLVGLPAHAQQGCTISGSTMVCPNGVTVGGVGQSVIIGGHSMGEGSGDRKTDDGRDVHIFGNQGVFIGGRGQAERLTPTEPPPPE
jgi:hypothetical protein